MQCRDQLTAAIEQRLMKSAGIFSITKPDSHSDPLIAMKLKKLHSFCKRKLTLAVNAFGIAIQSIWTQADG